MASTPTFEIDIKSDATLGEELLVGFASPAMASLIGVDHMVTDSETELVGHMTVSGLPTITPFTDGVPRYPIRLYTSTSGPTLVVCELFVPLEIGDHFADALTDLAADHSIEEITVLYGVSYPHGPEQHAVFSVATGAYQHAGLDEAGVEPLQGGFLDGTPAQLLQAGIDDGGPAVGVLVTPAHPPGPDFEAALRMLAVVEHHYDITVDPTQLEEQSEEIQRYYEELAARIEAESVDKDLPEDRMYM
jgi:uncharacterized protein